MGGNPLQRSSRYILLLQQTGLWDIGFEGSYLFTEKQSVYSTAPADWTTGHSLGGLTPLQRSSRCILHRCLRTSFSRTDSGLFVWSNLNFLHNSQWIPLPTQLCLVLHSLGANLQHSLIMCLMVSSLSPHNLHLVFCCVLSILTLMWLVLMACPVLLLKEIVSLLKFPFLSHVQVFSWECHLLVA